MRALLTATLIGLTTLASPAGFAHEAHAQGAPGGPARIEAPSGKYKVDLGHASIVFRVDHMGISKYPIRFSKFDSTIEYDAADPTRSKLSVTIDPRSIRTEYPFVEREDFDKELAGDKWLNAAKFPEIRFTSTSITRAGPTSGRLAGNLTFMGVTKPVTLDVTYNGAINHPFSKKPTMGVSATGRFNRSDFGLKQGIPFVGDEVELTIEAEYARQ